MTDCTGHGGSAAGADQCPPLGVFHDLRWWRTLPPPRAVGWLLASFVVLSAAAAAAAWRMPAMAPPPHCSG